MPIIVTRDEPKFNRIEQGLALLEKWDYKYDLRSVGATVFEMWEFMIQTYMH